jgi:hypothetical protein
LPHHGAKAESGHPAEYFLGLTVEQHRFAMHDLLKWVQNRDGGL